MVENLGLPRPPRRADGTEGDTPNTSVAHRFVMTSSLSYLTWVAIGRSCTDVIGPQRRSQAGRRRPKTFSILRIGTVRQVKGRCATPLRYRYCERIEHEFEDHAAALAHPLSPCLAPVVCLAPLDT